MYEHSPAVFGYETGGAVSVRPPESTPQAANEAKLPAHPFHRRRAKQSRRPLPPPVRDAILLKEEP